MRIKCPECETFLDVPDNQINKKGRCLSCGKKFLIDRSLLDDLSANPIDSDDVLKNESKIIHDKIVQVADVEPVASVYNGFLVRSIPALFFTSLGMFLGLFIGFYIGKSLSSNGNNKTMKMEMTPVINSNGDTVDPFGID